MSFFKELKEDIAQSVSELSEALEDDLDGRNEEDSTDQSAIEDIVLEEPKAEDDSDPAAGLDTDELADLTAMYGAELQGDAPDTKQTDTDFVNMGIAEFPGTGDIEAKGTVFEDILTETAQPEETEGIEEETYEEESYEEESYEYEEPITEQEESKEDFNMNEDFVNNMDMEEQTEGMEEVMEEETSSPSEEITVITQGTIISGSIKSDTSLLVKGTIEGDVECEGKLTIEGRVAGNTIAKEIYVNTPRLLLRLMSGQWYWEASAVRQWSLPEQSRAILMSMVLLLLILLPLSKAMSGQNPFRSTAALSLKEAIPSLMQMWILTGFSNSKKGISGG